MTILVNSGVTERNKLSCSEEGKSVVQRCAEDGGRVITECLNIAHRSPNRLTRESRVQVARGKLAELKQLESACSFLHLENLEAVEASIAAVEAETRELIKVQDAPSLPAGKTVGELMKSNGAAA